MNVTQSNAYDRAQFQRLITHAHQIYGYGMRELSRLTGVNHAYISQILNGHRRPNRDILIRLCSFGWGMPLEECNAILTSAGYKPLSDALP